MHWPLALNGQILHCWIYILHWWIYQFSNIKLITISINISSSLWNPAYKPHVPFLPPQWTASWEINYHLPFSTFRCIRKKKKEKENEKIKNEELATSTILALARAHRITHAVQAIGAFSLCELGLAPSQAEQEVVSHRRTSAPSCWSQSSALSHRNGFLWFSFLIDYRWQNKMTFNTGTDS